MTGNDDSTFLEEEVEETLVNLIHRIEKEEEDAKNQVKEEEDDLEEKDKENAWNPNIMTKEGEEVGGGDLIIRTNKRTWDERTTQRQRETESHLLLDLLSVSASSSAKKSVDKSVENHFQQKNQRKRSQQSDSSFQDKQHPRVDHHHKKEDEQLKESTSFHGEDEQEDEQEDDDDDDDDGYPTPEVETKTCQMQVIVRGIPTQTFLPFIPTHVPSNPSRIRCGLSKTTRVRNPLHPHLYLTKQRNITMSRTREEEGEGKS